ncbi:MAG: DUF2783 domain-containing protein [Pseudomonadota bacterium]
MDEESGLGLDGDDFYELLLRCHEGLSEEDSHALNTRLVLLMAEAIGDIEVLDKLLRAAKESGKSLKNNV